MSKENNFQKALSNFTFEVASDGAIRHLAGHGYTVPQISKKLNFPTPYERIQRIVWESMLDNRILLLEEPGNAGIHKKISYIQDRDSYGRTSFRQVIVSEATLPEIHWTTYTYDPDTHGPLSDLLSAKYAANSEDAYASCDFGLRLLKDPAGFSDSLKVLEENQREYILGLPWVSSVVYHRLDLRMRTILVRLYENDLYQGCCYFGTTGEKVILN